jgi:hypothetical protein
MYTLSYWQIVGIDQFSNPNKSSLPIPLRVQGPKNKFISKCIIEKMSLLIIDLCKLHNCFK